mgnify:CR=1 FL=1
MSDNFTQDVSTENPAILSALCRPVNTLFDEQDMVSTDAYLKSSDSAYTANVDISQTTGQVNIGDALVKGQQNYMAVGSKAKFTDDNKTLYSNVIAVGSEGMLSDTYLQYSQYQNSELFHKRYKRPYWKDRRYHYHTKNYHRQCFRYHSAAENSS